MCYYLSNLKRFSEITKTKNAILLYILFLVILINYQIQKIFIITIIKNEIQKK